MSSFLDTNNPASLLPSVKLEIPVPEGMDSGFNLGGDLNKLRSRFLDLHGDVRAATGADDVLGFFGVPRVARPVVTGSRGGNAALASMLTALASLGLIIDSTTA